METTKKCHYCQSDISIKATICPNCRKKQKKKASKKMIITMFVLIGVLIVVANIWDSIPQTAERTSWSCSYDVKEYIKTYYKSPSTVEFTSCNYQISWNIMTIVWEADSQNWFGATVRSSFKCVEDSIAKTTNCNIIE